MKIELNKIRPDKDQPRKTFDEDKLKLMSQTFKSQGTIQPIEIDEKNKIVTGELRWRAAKIAGLKEISVRVLKGLTKEKRLERQLVENFNRQDMKVKDAEDSIKKYLKLVRTSHRDGAKRLGIDEGWLSNILKFEREAEPELKEAVHSGKMPISTAVELINAPKKIVRDVLKEEKVPVRERIRERIREKKELENLKKKNEEIKKSKKWEVKVTTTQDVLNDIKQGIIDTHKDLSSLMGRVRRIRKTKFYLYKPQQKESFIRFLDGASERARKWATELDDLKDNIELEIVKE